MWARSNLTRLFFATLAWLTLASTCNAAPPPPIAVQRTGAAEYQHGLRDEMHQHYGTAMELLKKAAKAGNSDAERGIGHLYAEGRGVLRDYRTAMKWYQRAAAAGNAKAALRLGKLYESGLGAERNLGASALWYGKSVMMGGHVGLEMIGSLCKKKGFSSKYRKSVLNSFEVAATAGNANAMLALAGLYGEGWLVPRDTRQALEWDRKAVQAGSSVAMFAIGIHYEYGNNPNMERAMVWYHRAAASGNALAMMHIGVLYMGGQGPSPRLRQGDAMAA